MIRKVRFISKVFDNQLKKISSKITKLKTYLSISFKKGQGQAVHN